MKPKKHTPAEAIQDLVAIPKEAVKVYLAFARLGLRDIPTSVLRSVIKDSQLDSIQKPERFFEILGETLLGLFDSLGPVYGKAGQMALSRLPEEGQSLADKIRLTRLYGDWPAMGLDQVNQILDREIPHWRTEFRLDPNPIGVASMAQVHKLRSKDGQVWVIKILKPHAEKRLLETLAALDQAIKIMDSMLFSSLYDRFLRELKEVSAALRKEVRLDLEKDSIDKIHLKLSKRKVKVLRVPETLDQFSTAKVLTQEYFEGTPLTDLVTNKVTLLPEARKTLAKKVLSELLIQVFEVGLFHADPHAGNLILLEDGTVGLFDWGLTGSLTESDKKHIAAILKAIIARDLDRVAEALHRMSLEQGQEVPLEVITKEMNAVAKLIKKRQESKKPIPLQELFEQCIKRSDSVGIAIFSWRKAS